MSISQVKADPIDSCPDTVGVITLVRALQWINMELQVTHSTVTAKVTKKDRRGASNDDEVQRASGSAVKSDREKQKGQKKNAQCTPGQQRLEKASRKAASSSGHPEAEKTRIYNLRQPRHPLRSPELLSSPCEPRYVRCCSLDKANSKPGEQYE